MSDESRPGINSWAEFDQARESTDLSSLPEAVRAIVELCRAEQDAEAAAAKSAVTEDGLELPYTCRMYESVSGEEELLQLQWMRIDMSNMDSDLCWGQPSGCAEDHDCGPDAGLFLPAVYRVDPAQLFPLTFVGVPPELLRVQEPSEIPSQQALGRQEHGLSKLGKEVTAALSRSKWRREEGLPQDLVRAVASLPRAEWDACLEHHVQLRTCSLGAFAELISSRSPPTLKCLLHTVLPSLISGISFDNPTEAGQSRNRDSLQTEADADELDGVWAVCEPAGVAASREGFDPVRFRNMISASGLRNLGPLGREAEVALAESFFGAG